MDINDARSILTVLGLVCFVAISLWAFSSGARKRFEEAALLPFSEDDLPVSHQEGRQTKEGNKNG